MNILPPPPDSTPELPAHASYPSSSASRPREAGYALRSLTFGLGLSLSAVAADPSWEIVGQPIRALKTILPTHSGKVIVAGDFDAIGGQTASGIARLLPDGEVDPQFNFVAPLPRYYYQDGPVSTSPGTPKA